MSKNTATKAESGTHLTARSVQAHLEQTGIEQLAWVLKAADLNIIAKVWGRMKVALKRTPMPSATEDELWAAVLAEWQRLASDASLVTALYESLPSKCQLSSKSTATGHTTKGVSIGSLRFFNGPDQRLSLEKA